FEFFRQHGRKPSEKGSLGLGLFIAREIVSAHAGTLCLEAGSDETVFTVHLPRAPYQQYRAQPEVH
ncbi:MAG: hybrid sensor histidine kinase/response regulator, partial [Myxococcaceae bacterium]